MSVYKWRDISSLLALGTSLHGPISMSLKISLIRDVFSWVLLSPNNSQGTSQEQWLASLASNYWCFGWHELAVVQFCLFSLIDASSALVSAESTHSLQNQLFCHASFCLPPLHHFISPFHLLLLRQVNYLWVWLSPFTETESEKWKSLSRIQLFVTPRTIQSMEFSRSEYWSW